MMNSMENIRDEYIIEAFEANEKSVSKKRRIIPMALAAVLAVMLLAVTAFAYGDDIISAIFKRQKELVDDKSQIINVEAKAGNVTLSTVKVNVQNFSGNNFSGLLKITFSNDDGFEKGLYFDEIKIESLSGDADTNSNLENMTKFYDEGIKDSGILKGSAAKTLSLEYPISAPFGDFRLTLSDLSDYSGEIHYSDELSIDFSVKKKAVVPTDELSYYVPENNEFELEGYKFQIDHIDLSSDSLQIWIKNIDGDIFSADGKEFYATNLLCDVWQIRERYDAREAERIFTHLNPDKFNNCDEWRELDEKINEYPYCEEGMEEYVQKMGYEIKVELDPACGAKLKHEVDDSVQSNTGPQIVFKDGMDKAEFSNAAARSMGLTSPIYVSDIRRIYAEKRDDPSVQVNIWVPAEDAQLTLK